MEMKKDSKIKTILFCVWVVVAFLLIQIGVSVASAIPLAVISAVEAAGDMSKYMTIYYDKAVNSGFVTIVTCVSTVLALLVSSIWYYNGYYKKKKAEGRTEKLLPKLKGGYSAGFLIAGIIGTYALAVILQGIIAKLMPGVNEIFNNAMSLSVGGNEILGILVVLLLAPINEELVVRGIVIERSKRSFGIVGCLVLSALLFGFYHLNPIQGLYVLPMGVFWGYLAYRYNTVILPMIGHIINNVIGTFVGPYIDFDKVWWIVLIVAAVTLTVVVICLKHLNAEKVTSSDESAEPERDFSSEGVNEL